METLTVADKPTSRQTFALRRNLRLLLQRAYGHVSSSLCFLFQRLSMFIGPTCKKMNDLKQTAVFLSSAFQPTSEDLKRATQRKYPAPKNRNFTGSNPGSSRDLPTREEIQAAMMEVSDSDDSLPDISTIIKNHKPSSNGKSKGKTRTIEVDSASDDVSPCQLLLTCIYMGSLKFVLRILLTLLWATLLVACANPTFGRRLVRGNITNGMEHRPLLSHRRNIYWLLGVKVARTWKPA